MLSLRDAVRPAYLASLDFRRVVLLAVQDAVQRLLPISLQEQRCPVATLCSAATFQCEGDRIWQRHPDAKPWDVRDALSAFASIWDLSRPILFQKSPGHDLSHAVDFAEDVNRLSAKDLPAEMQAQGIIKLVPRSIILWRPLCLAKLSKSATIQRGWKPGYKYTPEQMEQRWALEEVEALESQV